MKKNFMILLIASILFTSCIGLAIDIRMNRDGSGKLTMEYRISQTLDSLGTLDGNREMPAIPVSRSDWEKTVQRISGAKIASYSRRQSGQDTVMTVTLEYDSIDTLLTLLSPEASSAPITASKNQNSINLILNDGSLDLNDTDKELMELARKMFTGYNFSIGFSASGNSTLAFTDGNGSEINKPSSVEAVTGGRRVSMSIGIMDLVENREGLGVRFSW